MTAQLRSAVYNVAISVCTVSQAMLTLCNAMLCICNVLQASFIGGRLAMRRALHQSGIADNCSSILKDSFGAPLLPQGILGSISHKQQVAVALVSNTCQGYIGVYIYRAAICILSCTGELTS
jgi:4'-phosphopantetheinyl transferase EntD